MSTAQWAWLALAAVLAFWMVGAYNRLVRLRQAVVLAWQQYDQQLQRRAVLLPALLQSLREPLQAEHATLDAAQAAEAQVRAATARMRSRPLRPEPARALAHAVAQLDSALTRLLALAEQQPSLRDGADVSAARLELNDVDLRLAMVRQLYNDAAGDYEAAARQWPTALLTRIYGFADPGRL